VVLIEEVVVLVVVSASLVFHFYSELQSLPLLQ